MSVNYQQFPFVSQDLIDTLQNIYPIKLSTKEDDDFDRGVAYGRQSIIETLKIVRDKQLKNK